VSVIYSKKSRKGRFYVGQFVADERKAGVVITQVLTGFLKYEDALGALENVKARTGNETYVLIEVKDEVRSKTSLYHIEP
jgi:hypothetical protein